MNEPRVVVVGLGPIGREIARALGSRLHGCVEVRADAPDLGVPVWRRLGDARGAEISVLATGSRISDVVQTVREALDAGLHVVSTCEELAYPWVRHSDLAREMDVAARTAGRVVLGTGVNPGFVMDRLPSLLIRACVSVSSVEVERYVDLANRRDPLRRKVGVGLPEAAWREQADVGKLGHVGLAESAAMLATALSWRADDVAESLSPIVEAETVRGLRQEAVAAQGRMRLHLEMALGIEARDRVRIQGDPPIHVEIPEGVHGDRATVGAALDAVARVASLGPGLRTVLDLSLA